MNEYVVRIVVKADNPEQVKELGNLMQFAATNINRADLVKLLAKVKDNPGIVKTALKFI